jgi:hypothetical protein
MAVPIVAFPPQNIIGFVAFFSWLSVQLGRYLVNFKVDSGAVVSAISLDDYNKLSPPPKCRLSQARLVRVAHQPLETVGVFAAEMKYKSITHKEKIFVIKGFDDNILSRKACDSLSVIEFKGDRNLTLPSAPQCLHSNLAKPISSTLRDPKVTFPECSAGLGRKAPEYKITRRNLRSTVPMPSTTEIKAKDQAKRAAQKAHYDFRYKAWISPTLNVGDRVRIKYVQREGKVVRKCSKPSKCSDATSISDFSSEGEDMHNGNFNLHVDIPGQQADDRPDELQEEVQPQVQDPPFLHT